MSPWNWAGAAPAAVSAPGGAAGAAAASGTAALTRRLPSSFPLPLGLAALLLVACAGNGPPAREPTPTAAPSPSPTAVATPGHSSGESGALAQPFDAERALAHVRVLAADIGSRPSGSEAERRAAEYIREQLAGYGYEAALQGFTFEEFKDAGSTLDVLSPQPLSPEVQALEPSVNGVVDAELMDAGLGRPQDFPPDAAGKIALMERGGLRFGEKAANAAAAGAAAAVVYNNEPGLFRGRLGEAAAIPVVGISREDGRALLRLLAAGPVGVRLEVKTQSGVKESQNVAARPPGGECRVIAGGHYDSVPAGPGANDNASGTATVLEMARALAADGEIDDVCFVLFGSEEVGLIGSATFAASLSADEKELLEGMLNFDMVGVGTDWTLAGSLALRELAENEAGRLGMHYTATADPLPGSDHASFLQVGAPAVFLHRMFSEPADDPRYHSANDTFEFVEQENLALAGRLGLALVDALLRQR